MATLKEQDIVLTSKDASGNPVIQMPITRAANVEDLTTTCLPLSGGNLSGNLTVQSKNVVRSVNGTAADVSGNVAITIPSAYTLPNATSSTLGGVKIGSNITVSSGTISLSKSNVTSALGYTPLQTAPVTSVNGKTGAVTISTGISLASSKTDLSAGTWTATGSGMVFVQGYTGTWGSQTTTLNGIRVGGWRGKECGGCTLFPVKKGDVVVISESACSEQVRHFIPFN